jgi:hypothetical protein
MAADRVASRGLLAAGLLWLVLVVAGMAALWAYASTPGPSAKAGMTWPSGAFARDARRPTLVMFLHPQCSCSQASVGELARLMAHAQGRVRVYVFVSRSSEATPGSERTDLWHSAAEIPGVEVRSDDNDVQSAAFGAAVSGQTLLYDAQGHLIFSGGITAARGHAGDNAGRSAILALLTGGVPAAATTPVFGCFLRSESQL